MAYKEVWFGEGEGGYWGLEYVPDSPVATGKSVEPSAMSGTELIEYMQRNDFSPAQAAAATGISEGSIISSVGKTIDPNSSLNLGGTIIQPVYSSRGEGDTFEQGSLSEIIVYNQNQGTGDPYRTFATNGQQIGAGQFQKVGGFGQMLKEMSSQYGPIILAAATFGGGGAALGSALGFGTGATGAAIGNALINGTLSEAQGGDFLQGAAKGAISSSAGSFISPAISEALGGGQFGNITAGALTGGGVSELMGGDFLPGALSGGIFAGLKDYQQQLTQEQFDTAMTESGLAGQTSIDEFVAPQVDLTAPSVQDVINQISAPADQVDDGVQEIIITAPREQTVPTQADMQSSIDALLLQLAPYEVTSENIDLNKFVNELVGGVPAEPDMQPEAVDNSKLIAALDVLKVLSPIAITALLAKNKTPSGADEQTGYPILPIPSDWKSPTYNQAFTPSAPIDFGTPALLAGTQWESPQQTQAPQPYTLTNLINTLNYQPVPFVPQQYEIPQSTMNIYDVIGQYKVPSSTNSPNIIGNLAGNPVSIADIISGIQSQYGQKTSS